MGKEYVERCGEWDEGLHRMMWDIAKLDTDENLLSVRCRNFICRVPKQDSNPLLWIYCRHYKLPFSLKHRSTFLRYLRQHGWDITAKVSLWYNGSFSLSIDCEMKSQCLIGPLAYWSSASPTIIFYLYWTKKIFSKNRHVSSAWLHELCKKRQVCWTYLEYITFYKPT